MKKIFNHRSIEQIWYQIWEEKKYFTPSSKGHPYIIMMPPPNATGSLHMGHAFQNSIMDALIRYQRMKQRNTLWQVGTDHAGIATQMIVERKMLSEEGKTRYDYGRKEFTKKIWEWQKESSSTITHQLRRLGVSVDWQNERFTMDHGFYKAVQEVFIHLYKDDLIYRGKRLVNWDTKLQTAISDLEVENKNVQGHIWYLRYPLADGIKTAQGVDSIVVATTRPETMFGDTGIAVNPDDERYKTLIGKDIILPLVNRRIPIVADKHAVMEKGTGCVKITPAHDFNDNTVGKRCGLPMINIMTLKGRILKQGDAYNNDGTINNTINVSIPYKYHGLERFAARKQIVADFNAAGLLDAIKDYNLTVPYGGRSGVIIEPLLTDQWFVRAAPLSKAALKAVEDGLIQFIPRQYENMYYSWMQDIQDWCISRQLWWGHRIPAWYDEHGTVYVGRNENEVRQQSNLSKDVLLKQDDDVLDTWFSSALWTFVTLGWPESTERLKTFYSTDVLVTGFDIIFFWVARMIMMSMYFMKDTEGNPQIPFKHVYVTGLIRDEKGEKMSKSKGNVLDPLDLIDGIDLERLVEKRTSNMLQPKQAEKIKQYTRKTFSKGIAAHGTDALRFTLYSLASTSRYIYWDMKRLEGYKKFCNKIWNAAKYVQISTKGEDCGQHGGEIKLTLADHWIISSLQRLIAQIEKNFADFRLDYASQNLYDFIWNEYCAWYLELSKQVLWDKHASQNLKRGTRHTLVHVLETICRLIHPFMPFISEEIWQNIKDEAGVDGETLMLKKYPIIDIKKLNEKAEQDIVWLKRFITNIRNIRVELNIGPTYKLHVILRNLSLEDSRRFNDNNTFLKSLAKLSDITILNEDAPIPISITQLIGNMEILVPISLINKVQEVTRLSKTVDRLEKDVKRFADKLANEQFIRNAKPEIVNKERNKLAGALVAKDRLNRQLKAIQVLYR